MEERLNKWLSRMGVCSRREADRLIQEGKVLIDGKVAQMGQRVEDGQKVICDGKPVGDTDGGRGEVKPPRPVLLAVNKPRGIVCTTSDKDRAENIVEMLSYPERIYPIGRLDKESEGLILMTNQGDLVNKIMRAGNYHEKEYLVTVDKPIDSAFVKKMASGIPILDTITRRCFVEKTGKTSFRIILTQGLNRQIRRMCEYLGYQVQTLKRVRIMELTLDGLKEGEYRQASREEWAKLEKGIANSSQLPSSNHQKTGGHHGKFSTANERTGRNPEWRREGVLPGRQGNHEQSGVRQPVRPAGAAGKRNRHRSHK